MKGCSVGNPQRDYGPSVVQGADGRLTSVGAGKVIIEARLDPTDSARKSLVIGARRASVLQGLYHRGSIAKPLWLAAQRFIDDMALAAGHSGGDTAGVRSSPWSYDPSQRQLDAQQRVRRALRELSPQEQNVFWLVVVHDYAIRRVAAMLRVRQGTVTNLLRMGLEALDAHYNPPVRSRRFDVV